MKNKVLYIIMIIAIILGAIIVKIKGFNYGTIYTDHKRLEIIIGTDYDLKDAKKIVDETIKTDHVSRKATLYGTTLAIDAKDFKDDEITELFSKLNEKYSKSYKIKDLKKVDILESLGVESINSLSEEELADIISRISEKYGLDYTTEELQDSSTKVRMYNVSKISVWDIVKNFISPLIISLIIIMVYYGIRFAKLYKNAWILAPISLACKLILNQLFLLAIIAIARIPVSTYLPAILLTIWLLQLVSETIKAEKKLKESKEEN